MKKVRFLGLDVFETRGNDLKLLVVISRIPRNEDFKPVLHGEAGRAVRLLTSKP